MTIYSISGKCFIVGTQTHADVSHSMFFISYSWEMKAKHKTIQNKTTKNKLPQVPIFQKYNTSWNDKEFDRNYQYLHFFFYLQLTKRKLLALYYIFSFNIFLCKQKILLQESSSLVFWHHFEVCKWTTILSRTTVVAATQMQRWSQSNTYNIMEKINSWHHDLCYWCQVWDTRAATGWDVMWAGIRGRSLLNKFVPSFKRIDWVHFFTKSMFGVAYYHTTHTIFAACILCTICKCSVWMAYMDDISVV